MDYAQFRLAYNSQGLEYNIRHASYIILSSLKSDNDLIIEINSSLFSMSESKKEPFIKNLLESAKSLGLYYQYKKVPAYAKQNIFSLFFNKNVSHAYEVFIYVPHKIWSTDEFSNFLHLCCARYYITKESVEASTIIDNMQQMTDNEKLDFFKLIVFNNVTYGGMGINTHSLSIPDINQLLEL